MAGLPRLPLGQRAQRRRVVVDEHRAGQLVLDHVLEQVVHEHVVMLAGRRAMPCCFAASRDGRRRRPSATPTCSRNRSRVLGPLPGRREVDRLVAVRQLHAAAADGIDAGDDQALGQVHHGAVVAVRLVQLHHREFGIVLAG